MALGGDKCTSPRQNSKFKYFSCEQITFIKNDCCGRVDYKVRYTEVMTATFPIDLLAARILKFLKRLRLIGKSGHKNLTAQRYNMKYRYHSMVILIGEMVLILLKKILACRFFKIIKKTSFLKGIINWRFCKSRQLLIFLLLILTTISYHGYELDTKLCLGYLYHYSTIYWLFFRGCCSSSIKHLFPL